MRDGIVKATWGTLANGYRFDFARQWVYDNHPYTRFPDEKVKEIVPPYGMNTRIAPYYNWRFWGTPGNPLFWQ